MCVFMLACVCVCEFFLMHVCGFVCVCFVVCVRVCVYVAW